MVSPPGVSRRWVESITPESGKRLSARVNHFPNAIRLASGLNLVVSAIILWNTVYLSRVVETLRAEGHDLPDHIIRHVSPQIWEHINLTGIYDWRGEAQQKGTFRPLRAAQEKLRGAA
jgi:Tn3 transposase DDE domain